MSSPDGRDAAQSNGHAAGRNGARGGRRGIRLLDKPNFGMAPLTPDQGCVGCLIMLGIFVATVAVWVVIYWYNEPVFHAGGDSVPTGRGTIRRGAEPRPSASMPQGGGTQGKGDGK